MKASTLIMLFFSVTESVPEVILHRTSVVGSGETLGMKVMLVCGQVWN